MGRKDLPPGQNRDACLFFSGRSQCLLDLIDAPKYLAENFYHSGVFHLHWTYTHTHTWILADSERQPSILHSEILICFITAAHAKYFPFRTLLLNHLALLIQLFQSFCVTMSSSFVLVRPIDSKEKAVQFVKFFILSDYVSYMA